VAGGKDWESNLATALGHRNAQHRLQFHHILPKGVLKGSVSAKPSGVVSVMQKTESSVLDLVSMIQRGDLRLPEMQRGYVWRATRVRDLFDSLYRGYPSGNILVWETDFAMPQRNMAVGQQENPFRGFKLLLDGQQRLTSLSAILRGEPVQVRGRKKPIEILFNLELPETLEEVLEVEEDEDSDPFGTDDDEDADQDLSIEERAQKLTFVVSSRRLASLPNWIKVTDVFKSDNDASFLKKAGVKGFDDPRYEKYAARLQQLRAIRKYMYSVQILERGMTYDEVTGVFVRVNSLGAKLRSSDLALAQITARWRGTLAVLDEFSEECDEAGFPIELGTLIRGLIVHITAQCRFKTVSSLSLEELQNGWVGAKKCLRYAVNFLTKNAGIESPALLTSPYALLTLSFAAKQFDGKLSKGGAARLEFWVRVANGRGRYSRGSSETYLDQDLAWIRSGKPLSGLTDAIRQQFGRIHFDVEEFEGRNQRASLFRLMFQALTSAGALDWNSGIRISVENYGADHKLQFHHIFPKAVLRERYPKSEINDIANLAFIGGRTNRSISAKQPKDYLPMVIAKQGEEALISQCVPVDRSLWTLEKYSEFMAARRKLLAARVNKYLGAPPS